MNQYQKARLNKILIISAIAVALIIILAIFFVVDARNKREAEKVNYNDTVVGKNYFVEMVIDTETRKVQRDGKDTTLQEEFGATDTKAELMLSSIQDVKEFFENSTVEVEMRERKIYLKNPYQTKTLIVEADDIQDNFDAKEEIAMPGGLYILKYDTQKRTKAAFQYLQQQLGIKNIETDQISIVRTINDESQTMYGEAKEEQNDKSKVYGVSAMGLNNYKNIIKENGNPANVVIATIGYGAAIENKYFSGRISDDYFNFIGEDSNSKDIHETIAQGSRILEVIKESTTDNVKIMPLVVINDEYYTTTASIINAINYAIENADVICYEFIHEKNHMIELALQNAFKENVPVCCVTKMNKEDEENFPADNPTTIAVSSVDKELKTTSYSANGEYVDFVASSTDIQEIFNTSSTVSRWSGSGYSNAQIASIIALIKTYNKDITLLETYNTIRNYCQDLGDKGKDNVYGYGFPNFSEIKISDIDKELPKITEANIDDSKWEKEKEIKIKGSDNIRIYGWNVTKSEDVPTKWERIDKVANSLDVKEKIDENATYYIWVTDSAGNVSYLSKKITKIDNDGPSIQYTIDESKKDTEKYVTINVTSTDAESGLHQMPYSWDKQSWGTDNNVLKVTKNGTYTIYVRDALENISEKTIVVKSLPVEGTAELDGGNIIKNIKVSSKWSGNKNEEVTITLNNNIDIQKWKVTQSDVAPKEFEEEEQPEEENNNDTTNTAGDNTAEDTASENNTTARNETTVSATNNNPSQGYSNVTITISLKTDRKYYVWIKDANGNISSQGFIIKKVQ